MAKIVFGAGTSHTPMLLASDETLPRFGKPTATSSIATRRAGRSPMAICWKRPIPKLAHMVAPEHLVARQNVARDAAKHLRTALAAAKLDALIVLGDDQNESYLEDCRPAFAIYYGDTIRNDNDPAPDLFAFPGLVHQEPRRASSSRTSRATIRCMPASRPHLIETLMDTGFDMASSKCLREGEGEGHALAYVHRHVLDAANPVPVVPIFLNTYFPPNQPRPKRCYQFGQAMRTAVEAFPGDARVGILASGGLSHFLVDEEFDRAILKALADKDAGFLQNLPRNKLQCRQLGNSQLGRASPARSSISI